MVRKVWMTLAVTAMAAIVSTGAVAADNEKIEAGGFVFEIPGEFKDLLTVETENLPEDILISVSETASIEAAQAEELGYDGAGWLFSISRISEDDLQKLRCDDMSGQEVFAEYDAGDDDMYLLFNHPTDVRLVRENNDEMKAAMDQWSQLNEWAWDVRDTTLANNPQLDREYYSNTMLDMYLARAAYAKDINYEIRSLDFGTLNPTVYGEDDGLDDLVEDVYYEVVDDLPEEKQPDGEYIVLAFVDDNVQYDFFLGEGMGNYIREVRTLDDETYETLYEAHFDDANETATGAIKEWADSILHTDDDGDDDDDD